MSVLFLSYNGLLEPLLYSQGIVYLRELSRALNIEITVLSFEKLSFFINGKQQAKIINLKKGLLKDNIRWYYLIYHKYPPFLSSIFDILCGLVVSAYLVLRERISFIHARSYVPATIALVLAKVLKVKYIFDMRGFMIDDYVSLGIIEQDSLIERLAKQIEKAIIKNASQIIVLTRESRESLADLIQESLDHKNVEVIPCCVDIERFSSKNGKDGILLKELGLEGKFIFIYVGSLGPLYLFDKMLAFFKVARNLFSKAHLLIITPDLKEVLRERLRYNNANLFEDISYRQVNPEEIAKYIRLADVGIVFYLPSFSRRATCPTKIGEYLACGIPFITNAGIGDTEDWIDNYNIGAIVRSFDNAGYEKALNTIAKLLEDKNETKERCLCAAKELLSLEIAREKYSSVYQDMLSTITK